MVRRDTLFSIRYAVRVLEHHASLWRRIDASVRFAALLAGSGAFAALAAENQAFSLGLGIAFAVFQAIEFSIRPAEKVAASLSARKLYAALYADQSTLDDPALEIAYWRIVAADEVNVPDILKRIAYNDVLTERGDDESYLYTRTAWQRFLALLA